MKQKKMKYTGYVASLGRWGMRTARIANHMPAGTLMPARNFTLRSEGEEVRSVLWPYGFLFEIGLKGMENVYVIY
jgi:hypothetical protein